LSPRRLADDGVLAALPLAASLLLLLARWLPLRFEYTPNDLGIVSLATLERYPQQQETFWWIVGLVGGALLVWLLARPLGAAALTATQRIALEASGVGALLALLWLPTPLSTPLLAVVLVGSLAWARRHRGGARGGAARHDVGVGPVARGASPSGGAGPRGRGWTWALGLLLLALGLTPTFWVSLWNVANGVPDELRTSDTFVFHGEIGQHLAWADALRRGELHGRDFFCLYGPLYDLLGVGVWRLLGRSIAAWELYASSARVLGWVCAWFLASLLVRRRVLLLALAFLLPWVSLRVGLPLAGLALLGLWLRDGRAALAAGAGAVAGLALLYSQEFGLVGVVSAGLAFALRRELRPALAWGAGLALALTPVLAWYAVQGALGPMLRDVVGYPAYVMAGYGKLPFPSLASALPLSARTGTPQELLMLRLGHALPAVCLAGLLLAIPVSRLDARRPLASVRRVMERLRDDPQRLLVVLVCVFGLLAFRSVLGRSDLLHVLTALPPAALLLVAAADRLLGARGASHGSRRLAVWRAAALALLVFAAGFFEAPTPLRQLSRSGRDAATLLRQGHEPVGSRSVVRVVRWLQLNTEPSDSVLFLPNDAAYYYLTERRSPIRFVMGHQIVTREHRREVLAALRAQPPRFVVWNHASARVDGLSDEQVFGAELLAWLDARYETQVRLGEVEVRRLREDARARGERPAAAAGRRPRAPSGSAR
jgi:hypothetical protein